MNEPIRKRKRKLKAEYSHIRKPKRLTKKLKKSTRSPWTSPDGEYMNEVAASAYLGLSVSRLQNMRCEGSGPMFHKPKGRVYYIKQELKNYIETGVGLSTL